MPLCVDLGTNSDFYNPDGVCLLRGTNTFLNIIQVNVNLQRVEGVGCFKLVVVIIIISITENPSTLLQVHFVSLRYEKL